MSLLSRHIETYDFYRGNQHWRVTDGDRPAIVEGLTYTALRGMKRGRMGQSPEEAKNALEIEVPTSFELLGQFRPFPPTSRIHLNVKRIRVSDGLIRSAWMGVVQDVDDSDPSIAKIRCQTLMAAAAGNGLRRVWQLPCGLPLYSVGLGMCNVNQDDFRVDTVLSGASGIVVQAGALAANGDGYYSGGFIRWQAGNDVEHRFIVSQVGDTAILLTPSGLANGAAVSIFPGCDHTLQTCNDKFGNALNHGGQHTIPSKNAFGDPVF